MVVGVTAFGPTGILGADGALGTVGALGAATTVIVGATVTD